LKREKTGKYITISTIGGESCKAFIPDPLPPKPPLQINADLQDSIDKTLLALGRLDSVATLLPDTSIFLYMYVRKEAVLSSQIEGTQSSLSDLLLYESDGIPGVPLDDVREVSNYVAAMNQGLARLREGFPLSLRLIKEVHQELLRQGRGTERAPGEFRRSQNWIGGDRPGNAVYVPPSPDSVPLCMGELEKFLHDQPEKTPVLIKAALSHAQFETIHPFLDGNGRLGRLLITLLLCSEGVLNEPILYSSLYLKVHRQKYYDLLQGTRTDGDWESWIAFFLDGIRKTAELAVKTAKTLGDLFENDRKKIESVGRVTGSVIRVHHALQRSPILTIPKAAKAAGLSFPTAQKAFTYLEKLRIVRENPKRGRARLFVYDEYIQILNEGTEPL
jgi:Fic family protein